jgi:hypothetical protein
MGSRYIVDRPEGLSARAIGFLRSSSRRVAFERGLTGQSLQREIVRVYGGQNGSIESLLDRLQERYGGLSYESGFFQSPVTFAPVCDPEDPNDELEILYAVETGSPVGASVKIDGQVEIGLDSAGINEFSDLDFLIECDAMFSVANALGEGVQSYLGSSSARAVVDALRVDEALGLNLVPRACGNHSYWLESGSTMIYATDVWGLLGGAMPPLFKAWTADVAGAERITRIVTQIHQPPGQG